MTKEQKIYCKVGQAVCKGLGMLTFSMMWAVIFIAFLMK